MGLCPLPDQAKASCRWACARACFTGLWAVAADVDRFAELYHQEVRRCWRCCNSGIAGRRYYTRPRVSYRCSYTATLRRLPICINAESALPEVVEQLRDRLCAGWLLAGLADTVGLFAPSFTSSRFGNSAWLRHLHASRRVSTARQYPLWPQPVGFPRHRIAFCRAPAWP